MSRRTTARWRIAGGDRLSANGTPCDMYGRAQWLAVDVIDLRRDLRMLVGTPGQAYLFRYRHGVMLIDTGRVGQGSDIAAALRDWGVDRDALTHVLLTHWHSDHTGSAAEIATWPGVRILAHRADALVIRGEIPGPDYVCTEREKALHEQVSAGLPDAPGVRVDHELDDSDLLADLGVRIVGTPGHTDGSMAVHLPDDGVLFTGDVAAEYEGQVILGPFNVDRVTARQSFRRLGELSAEIVCFGHGRPLIGSETRMLRQAATAERVPDPFG